MCTRVHTKILDKQRVLINQQSHPEWQKGCNGKGYYILSDKQNGMTRRPGGKKKTSFFWGFFFFSIIIIVAGEEDDKENGAPENKERLFNEVITKQNHSGDGKQVRKRR